MKARRIGEAGLPLAGRVGETGGVTPIARPLVATHDGLRGRRAKIVVVAGRQGAHRAQVLGSVARRDHWPASDAGPPLECELGRSLDLGGPMWNMEDL